MDPVLIAAVIGLVSAVVSGALVYAGVRFNGRQVAAANARTAALEGERVDLERIESLGKEVKDLRLQIKEDRADHHAEIVRLRNDNDGQMSRMTVRIADLERKRLGDRMALNTLSTYARALLTLLRLHQIEYPAPPDGLDVTGP